MAEYHSNDAGIHVLLKFQLHSGQAFVQYTWVKGQMNIEQMFRWCIFQLAVEGLPRVGDIMV